MGIDIKVKRSKHKTLKQLFPGHLKVRNNYIDAVHVKSRDYRDGVHRCKKKEDASNWSANFCKTKYGTKKVKKFNITINTPYQFDYSNYDACSVDPDSISYPKSKKIIHELSHAFGMDHISYWPLAERCFISTMQGKEDKLTAFDVAFLYYF